MNREPNRAPIPSAARVAVPVETLAELNELLALVHGEDRENVTFMLAEARDYDLLRAAAWIESNQNDYRLGLAVGFQPVEHDLKRTTHQPIVPPKEGD